MKKLVLILLILFSVLLTSCNKVIRYNNVENLLKDFKTEADWYTEQGYFIDNSGIVIGRYGNGYLIVVHVIDGIFEMPTYTSTTINGVEIFHAIYARFYYYINNKYGEDYIYSGLENIYKHGFLTYEDLLNIKSKFDAWEDEKYPYCKNEHYPID